VAPSGGYQAGDLSGKGLSRRGLVGMPLRCGSHGRASPDGEGGHGTEKCVSKGGVSGGDEEEGRECIWTNSTFLSFILFIFVSAFHRFPTAVWSGADEHLTPFNHTMRRLHSGSSHNTPTCCQRHATTCHFAESDWVVDVQLLRYCILTRALT
jgi:hypothetical protein